MIRVVLMIMALCLFSATAYTPEFHVTLLTKTNYPVKVKKIEDRLAMSEIAPLPVIIPRAKPELRKAGKPPFKIAQVRKCWRDTAKGNKKYRLRKVCRNGEREKP